MNELLEKKKIVDGEDEEQKRIKKEELKAVSVRVR